MGRTRGLLALLLVAASLTPASARPSGVIAAYSPEFAARTIVTGSKTGMEVVTLPRPVTISTDPFENPLVRIESDAPLAGVVLKQDVPRDAIEVMSLEVSMCASKDCDLRPLRFTQVYADRPTRRTVTLPAGRYLLYLLSDGSPVRATLSFPGLDGSTRVHPMPIASAAVGELEASLVDPTRRLYSAQTDHLLQNIGISLVGVRLSASRQDVTEIDACTSEKQAGVDVPVPHYLLCHGSSTVMTSEVGGEPGSQVLLTYEFIRGGDYTRSLNYRTLSDIEGSSAFHLHLSYPSGRRSGAMSGVVWGSSG